MIDPLTETLLSFPQAAELFAPYREGKPAHVSRLHRHRLYGYRGVYLEAMRQGGQWVTSKEAVARFMAALTAKLDEKCVNRPGSSDAALRARRERNEQELDALGV
jgi:hypothetical protein